MVEPKGKNRQTQTNKLTQTRCPFGTEAKKSLLPHLVSPFGICYWDSLLKSPLGLLLGYPLGIPFGHPMESERHPLVGHCCNWLLQVLCNSMVWSTLTHAVHCFMPGHGKTMSISLEEHQQVEGKAPSFKWSTNALQVILCYVSQWLKIRHAGLHCISENWCYVPQWFSIMEIIFSAKVPTVDNWGEMVR